MIVRAYILLSVAAFWGSIMWNLHKRGGFWAEWPISNELTGRYSNAVDIAFILAGIGIALVPFGLGYGLMHGYRLIADLVTFAAGAATIGAMLSRRVFPDQRVHIILSGIAFAGAGIGFALLSAFTAHYLMMWLALTSILPAGLALIANLKPLHAWLAKFSRVEWLTAALLMAWIALAMVTS